MNYRLLGKVFGTLLFFISGGMALSFGIALAGRSPDAHASGGFALAVSAIITLVSGLVLFALGRGSGRDLLRKEAVVIVGGGWIVSSLFGALPYMLCRPALGFDRALFEAMSGFTTTGSTVIADLDLYPAAILFWRSLTQWLGGMGILVLFVALLSYLGAGGKSLFRFESSAQMGESTSSRIRHTSLVLWSIYLLISVVCFLGLWAFGLSPFEAICHTFTAVATGGFSIYNDSIAHFKSAGVEVFLSVIMTLCGVSFLFYAALLRRDWRRVRNEEEARLYLTFIAAATALLVFQLMAVAEEPLGFGHALRAALFQVTTIITTTGFVTADYDVWPEFAKTLLLMLMIVGGSSGSTAGGIKVSRILLFFRTARREVITAFRPRQVFPIKLNGAPADAAARSAPFYVGLFAVCIAVGWLLLSVFEPGMDTMTTFSATLATLFNIGPGLGGVGPTQTFTAFSTPSYLVMTLLMVLGRLELFAVLVLFVPALWKKY